MKTVRIDTGRPYDALIGYGLLASLGEEIARRHALCRVALISDHTVHARYGARVKASLMAAGFGVTAFVIPPGETVKMPYTVIDLQRQLLQADFTRGDLVVALGGGVIGDIAGFVAATYMRGIDYVQAPTTLLAAVDASIGGKTGINLPEGKNLIGAFWQPILTICDCDVFSDLPMSVYLDGVAEALKYGVICDRALFESVTQGALEADCLDTVARCMQIKATLVSSDERDNGNRQLLNLGHTIGHALEMLSHYHITHGQGIAIGMVGAARIAEGLELCVMGCAGILMAMLDRLGLPSETAYSAQEIAGAVLKDKKRRGDEITLVLPESIGHCMLKTIPAAETTSMMRLAKGERL